MGKEKRLCEHCGASMMENRHTLNKPLASALSRLSHLGKPAHIPSLGFTHNQLSNFQKLKYWGLVQMIKGPDGTFKQGWWEATELGRAFAFGECRVFRSVYTFRGELVRADTEAGAVGINDLVPDYKKRPEYIAESVPHEQQGSFL